MVDVVVVDVFFINGEGAISASATPNDRGEPDDDQVDDTAA